jgi:hypothetical protein
MFSANLSMLAFHVSAVPTVPSTVCRPVGWLQTPSVFTVPPFICKRDDWGIISSYFRLNSEGSIDEGMPSSYSWG